MHSSSKLGIHLNASSVMLEKSHDLRESLVRQNKFSNIELNRFVLFLKDGSALRTFNELRLGKLLILKKSIVRISFESELFVTTNFEIKLLLITKNYLIIAKK